MLKDQRAERARLRLVVDNDRDLPLPPQSIFPRAPEWCRNAQAQRPTESRAASNCSRAAEISESDRSRLVVRTQSRRQPRELPVPIHLESCGDIKRGVYSASNITLNKCLNKLFRLEGMAERPIDRALQLAKEKGLNKSQFAAALQVLPQHVTNWIKRGMPPEYYAPAADVLDCSVDRLLGRNERLEPWLRDYYALEPEQQNEIREIAEDRIARFRSKGERKRLGGKQSTS